MSPLGAFPPIPDSALPAAVRDGSADGQEGLQGRARLRAGHARRAGQGAAPSPRRWPRARTPAPSTTPSRPPRSPTPAGSGLAAQLYAHDQAGGRHVSTDARGRAARPPRHADRAPRSACSRSILAQGDGDPRPRRRGRARAARRDPDRDGPPRRASSRTAPRCCSAPAPRSASPAAAVTLERMCTLITPERRRAPASAPPSCAACSPRSPASTASTAR